MVYTGNYRDSNFNKSELKYRFSNGSYIEFFSADQPDKLRGARRDILFINECNNVNFEAYQQLAIRTKKFIYLDYNPTSEFWVHTELMKDKDSDFIILTYKDNEALEPALVREIEKARDKAKHSAYWNNWWLVYGLGQVGSLEGVIFNNWIQISGLPKEAELLGYGMDFGFTNDPTALIAVYRYDGAVVLDELIYKTGLLNSDIIAEMKRLGVDPRAVIYADSAEPKTIEEIRRSGFNIKPTVKGTDSINFGISIMQEQEMKVTARSINLIKELRNYTWDKDKNGAKLNKPIDDWNHCFVGSTKITTSEGQKRIDEIKEGELVLTSKGYKPVLKKFNNGIKQISKYWMLFDTFSVYLECTPNHKIKTDSGWKEISQLTPKDKIFLQSSLMEKNTFYTQTKDTSVKERKGFTGRFGNIIKGLFRKDTTSTTKTETQKTIPYKICVWSKVLYTKSLKVKKGLEKILDFTRFSNQWESKKQKNGTRPKKGLNGIGNTPKDMGSGNSLTGQKTVMFANRNSQQEANPRNSAPINASHNGEGIQELTTNQGNVLSVDQTSSQTDIQKHQLVEISVIYSLEEPVHDLMIAENHEYFANGVLVHNCIDGARYFCMMALKKKKQSFVMVGGKVVS